MSLPDTKPGQPSVAAGAPRSTAHQLEIGERPNRVFGRLKGQIVVHGDFDADNDEIAREFEESVAKPLEPSAS